MKVVVNGLGLPTLREGGSGLYVRVLVGGLARREDIELRVLCEERVGAELADLPASVDVVPVARRRVGQAAKVIGLARSRLQDPRFYELGYRVGAAALSDADVVHYPITVMPPPATDAPCVVTALDIQHLAAPEHFTRKDRLLRAARWQPAIRAADRVIALSEFIRGSLSTHLAIDPDSVDVVPIGHDHAQSEGAESTGAPAGPFVFYPAAPLLAKNHARLLRAWRRVAAERPDASLVLSGPTDGHDWGPVRSIVRELGLEASVRLPGYLSEAELRAHYAQSRGLIFPSLYEGFGIPLIEAMAGGCPIAAARCASIPEVVGNCAHLFDPLDEHAIAGALRYLLEMPGQARAAAAGAGRERSRRFTVAAMVEGTVDCYAGALATRGRRAMNERIAPGSGKHAARTR